MVPFVDQDVKFRWQLRSGLKGWNKFLGDKSIEQLGSNVLEISVFLAMQGKSGALKLSFYVAQYYAAYFLDLTYRSA